MRVCIFNVYYDKNSRQTSSITRIYDPVLKILGKNGRFFVLSHTPSEMLYYYKWQVRYCCYIWTRASQSSLSDLGRIFLPDLIFTRVRLDQMSTIAAISGLEFINHNFLALVGSFCHTSSLQESDSIKIDYCCLIRTGTALFPLSSLDHVQRYLRNLVGDELFIHPTTRISQTKRYYRLASLLPFSRQRRITLFGSSPVLHR